MPSHTWINLEVKCGQEDLHVVRVGHDCPPHHRPPCHSREVVPGRWLLLGWRGVPRPSCGCFLAFIDLNPPRRRAFICSARHLTPLPHLPSTARAHQLRRSASHQLRRLHPGPRITSSREGSRGESQRTERASSAIPDIINVLPECRSLIIDSGALLCVEGRPSTGRRLIDPSRKASRQQ